MRQNTNVGWVRRYFGSLARNAEKQRSKDEDALQLDESNALSSAGGGWAPTHQHRKGGLYRVLGKGTLESDRTGMVIYDDEAGTIWLRPVAEFEDGRFHSIDGMLKGVA